MSVSGGGDEKQEKPAPAASGRPEIPSKVVDHDNRNGRHDKETSPSSTSDPYSNNHLAPSYWHPVSPGSSQRMLREQTSFRSSSAAEPETEAAATSSSRHRFPVPPPFAKIDWAALRSTSIAWARRPANMALLAWVAAVAVSGAVLFMVLTGMLNAVLRNKTQRDTWFEASNQVLNALFTLMCLVQHPRRFHHLALLCRWRAADMLALRQVYCKGGGVKPGERRHMAVVVLLLHLNCFAQYALCGLNLGLRRGRRPVVAVGLTVSVAICAPAVAGLYNNLSPLGKDYDAQPAGDDEESQQRSNSGGHHPRRLQRKKSYSMTPRGGRRDRHCRHGDDQEQHEEPRWAGGLFDDLWEDISLAYLSLLCSCCVFGWNASRLGMGNMYVHVVTFVLLCLAPFFIFNLAAINVDDEAVRDALGLAGVFLCVLGLLYGGFWRIQMRRRFGLPASGACCGKPDLTDCLQWLCCYSCALAQEVRTADAYEVVHDDDDRLVLCRRHDDDGPPLQGSSGVSLQDELSTMQQPLRFAGDFVASATTPPLGTDARPVTDGGVIVPPSMSVIQHK